MKHPLSGIVEATINRALGLDPELNRILAPVAGKCIAIHIKPGLELEFLVAIQQDGILILDPESRVADVTLIGNASALLGLLPETPWSASDEGIQVLGDSTVLMELKRALGQLRVDWQEPFAQIFGDTLGHSMTQGISQLAGALSRNARSLWLDTAEFLGEETDWLETRSSVDNFCSDVDQLRDDTARLEKRIQRLESRQMTSDVTP